MNLNRFFRYTMAVLGPVVLSLGIAFTAGAQPESADKILAVIGRNRIILQSDLEQTALQAQQQNNGAPFTDSMKCLLLQQMIMQKMLVEQAERDSLLVSDEQVEGTLENRVRYFISNVYGSKEKLEQTTGKTVYQLKEENREIIKEQMLSDNMRNKLLEHVKITPAEVQAFYRKIPADSLPFFPATVEVGQIVMDPPTNPELDLYAREQLEDIRKQIVAGGKSFETMAGLYSQDPGSRDNGGRIDGVTRDGGFAQEFVTAAFRLQNGEVSPIVKTKFGYHIIQMVQRKGEQVDVRHILIMPQHIPSDYEKAITRLDSVRAGLLTAKMSFPEAVGKYSTDDASKMYGGMLTDPRTGSTQMEVDQLDPSLALMIDSLKPGSFSQPHVFKTPQGEQSVRIVYLKGRTEPHKANLKDDYSKIQQVALSQKQSEKLEAWISEKLPTYYLRIDPQYSCGTLQKWSAITARK